jgi:adenylate cyclase
MQQSALLEQVTQVLRALAMQKPLLLALDDLQWADGGSVNLLFHLGRRIAGSRIMIVGAYRPAEVALGRAADSRMPESTGGGLEEMVGPKSAMRERHPLAFIVNELKRAAGQIEVDLERVPGKQFVDALLDSEPNCLGAAFREALLQRTQGHPLFTIELLRGMQERGDLLHDQESRWVEGPELDWETLPVRVEAVIAERIGRLASPLRAALRVASVEGQVFTAEVVARVRATDEGKMLGRLSGELDRRHRLLRAESIQRIDGQLLSRYGFRHTLFQKYLYNSLDEVERVHLHEQVGTALEELYGARKEVASVADSTQVLDVAVQLARHFQEARIAEKAIHYLHQAGSRALQLSAYEEAVAHLSQGLALLKSLPAAGDADRRHERARQEFELQLALGTALQGPKGFAAPETKRAYSRARELCLQVGTTSQLSRVVGELAIHHYVRAEHRQARELAEEALSLAQQAEDPLLAALGHCYLGFVLFALGEYTLARVHLQRMLAFYDPERHLHSLVSLRGSDAGLSALAYMGLCLWCLGYPEQAVTRSKEALALARELGHPFTLADVLCYAGCMLSELRHDARSLGDYAEAAIGLAEAKVRGWLPQAICFRGEALVMQGDVQEGMAQIREGMEGVELISLRCYLSGILGSLARAQAEAGDATGGLATVSQALAFVEETDERHWESELYRVQADLLQMQGKGVEAERSLHKAIEVARRQRAKSWELRATTSLAHLWHEQGRTAEAQALLAKIYGWFTEGLDTPDLLEAKALLETLAED